ncbi:MAG: serine/threonine protein kinase [Proteobacteria bacterium]|nr:serine/threonine protein kinase [Pseudomonadota bacterium]
MTDISHAQQEEATNSPAENHDNPNQEAPEEATNSPADIHDSPNADVPKADEINLQLIPQSMQARYRFIRELGAGAQGKVYLAERLSDGKPAAVKILRIDSVQTWKEYTLFHREAEVLASLDMPGIVKFYEACDCLDDAPPCSCIVQEYVSGQTLKTILNSGQRLSLSQVYDIAIELIDILEKLHKHDPPIIHRDIKPSNIILRPKDAGTHRVCLIDFGAVANPQIQSGGSTITGTFGYMSPEQNIGRPTPQSDIYALGAVIAYLLSGVDPAEMQTHDLRLIIDPYVENHPTALVQTLRRMLEPNLQDRLADYDELRKRFNDFKAGHYVLEHETHQPFSSSELTHRLYNVNHLCQPQNIDIWQNLPDIPQNRPPFPVQVFTEPKFFHYLTYANTPKINSFLDIILITVGLATISVLLLFVNYYLSHHGLHPDDIIFFISTCLIFTVCLVWCLIRWNGAEIRFWGKGGFHLARWDRPAIFYGSHKRVRKCTAHEQIYRTGFKTIAIITKIEYSQVSRLYISNRKELESGHKNHQIMFNQSRVEAPPTYKIFYKFNPPDDDTAKDIVHYFCIHQEPEALFKVGDPLPILYTGIKHADAPLHVTLSMPYPFPLDDLEESDDYIGRALTIPALDQGDIHELLFKQE